MDTKNSDDLKKEENNHKGRGNVDIFLIIGLLLYLIYALTNRFFIKVTDYVVYPWMIVSCICMLIGVYRTGKGLGKKLKK